jgi:UDP-3-O-[3-hydroxymyristoyl] glucosamine N-acyltransferase
MRNALKAMSFLLALVVVSPLILLSRLEEWFLGPEAERVFGACKELLALVPTPLGNFLRQAYYWGSCQDVAKFTSINFGSMIAHRSAVIADGVVIGSFSIVGSATIGRNVLIAPKVSILSGKYPHGRPEERAAHGKSEMSFEMISIGESSFIGQGAVVLANIGRHCTVGAGSVVNRDVPDGVTVMGNPARRVSLVAGDASAGDVGVTRSPDAAR